MLCRPLVQITDSVPVSVALLPLAAPRSEGVTANTGYGPRSTTLPPVSVTRTVTERWPAGSEVACTVSRLRLGQGAGWLKSQMRLAPVRTSRVVLGADDGRGEPGS